MPDDSPPSERTAVYRLYDNEDRLLYVGISCNPDVRCSRHAADKRWWPKVSHREVDWYSSRLNALAAEEAAIKAKSPVYNREHSPDWPRISVAVEISENMAQALDLLCRMLGTRAPDGKGPDRELAIWALLDREIAARGLRGDRPCFHAGILWPDGIVAERAGETCSCGSLITADGSMPIRQPDAPVSDDLAEPMRSLPAA